NLLSRSKPGYGFCGKSDPAFWHHCLVFAICPSPLPHRVGSTAIPVAVAGPVPPDERASPVLAPVITSLGAESPFAEVTFVQTRMLAAEPSAIKRWLPDATGICEGVLSLVLLPLIVAEGAMFPFAVAALA